MSIKMCTWIFLNFSKLLRQLSYTQFSRPIIQVDFLLYKEISVCQLSCYITGEMQFIDGMAE